MDLVIAPSGRVFAIFDETLDLSSLGCLSISRASHVEPTPDGRWTADIRPMIAVNVLSATCLSSLTGLREEMLSSRSICSWT